MRSLDDIDAATRLLDQGLSGHEIALTERHPKALLRGLIHSDVCRCVDRFTIRLPKGGDREYAYVRYFFLNRSLGIPS